MATSIGDLVVKFSGDIASLITATDKVDRNVKQLQRDIGKSMDAIDARFKQLVGVAIAYFSVDMFAGMVKSSIDAQGALLELSQRTGASVEGLSRLVNVGRLSSTNMEQIAAAGDKLAKGLMGVDDETKGAGAALGILGINARTSTGEFKKFDVLMVEIAKELNKYGDTMGKTQLLQMLFGKSGGQLAVMMKDLATQTDITGTVTEEAAARADQLADDWARLGIKGDALKNQFVQGIMPAMQGMVNTFLDMASAGGAAQGKMDELARDQSLIDWAEAVGKALLIAVEAIYAVGKAIHALVGSFQAVWADIKFAVQVQTLLRGATAYTPEVLAQLKAALDERNATVAESNRRYVDLWNYNSTQMSDAYAKQMSLIRLGLKAQADAAANQGERFLGGAARPKSALDDVAKKLEEAAKGKAATDELAKSLEKLQAKWQQVFATKAEGEAFIAPETIAGLEELDLLLQHGRISWEQYTAGIDHLLEKDPILRKETEELVKLFEKWSEVLAGQEAFISPETISGLEELDTLLQAGRISWDEYTKGIDYLLSRDPILRKEQEQIIDQLESYQKVLGELDDAEQRQADSVRQMVEGIQDQNDALSDEVKVMTLTGLQRELAINQLQREKALRGDLSPLAQARINQLYNEREALLRAREAGNQYNDAVDTMRGTLQSIDQYGMDLFESMADGLQGVSDWAKRAGQDLKRWLLGALYQLVARPFVINIAANIMGALGGGSAAGAAAQSLLGQSGGSGLLNLLSGGKTVFDLFGFGGTTMASSWAGGIASIFGPSAFTAGLAGDAFMPAALLASTSAGELSMATLGAAFAAAAPWLAIGAIAIPLIMSMFKKEPSPAKGQFAIRAPGTTTGWEDSAWVESIFGNIGFLDEATQQFSGEGAKKFSQVFADFFEGLADSLDEGQRDRIAARLQATVFPGFEGTYTTEDFLNKYGPDIFKQVASVIFEELNPAFAALIREFDGTIEEIGAFAGGLAALDEMLDELPADIAANLTKMVKPTQDSITNVAALANAYLTLQEAMNSDPVEDAAEAVRQANATAATAFTDSGEALRKLMDDFDGTTESALALADGTKAYYASLVNLLAGLQQVRAAILGEGGMLQSTKQMIEQTGMTDQERYDWLLDETERLRAQLAATTDPDMIYRLAERIDANVREAWELLSPEEQAANRDLFLANLTAYGSEIDARIVDAENRAKEEWSSNMTDLRGLLTEKFNEFGEAATTIGTAADKMLDAAETPHEVRVVTEDEGGTVVYGGGA